MEKLKLKSLADVGDVLSSEELRQVYSDLGSGSDGSGSEGSPRKREFVYSCVHGSPVRCTGYSAHIIKVLTHHGKLQFCLVCDNQTPQCCPIS